MYLMYVDESGDPGTVNSPTRYYILSSIVVHEMSWQSLLDDSVQFRRLLKARYGLLMKEEIHAAEFISRKVKLKNVITRNNRLDLLKKCLDWLNQRTDISVISVRVDKQQRTDPFEYAWRVLIQRFDNTLAYKNFPGPAMGTDKGMIICDHTDAKKLTKLLREMRRYNQVSNMISYGQGSRNIPLRAIVEDPSFRDSSYSYFLQFVDAIAYFVKQYYDPNKYIRNKGARGFYGRIYSIINKYARKGTTNFKIVEI